MYVNRRVAVASAAALIVLAVLVVLTSAATSPPLNGNSSHPATPTPTSTTCQLSTHASDSTQLQCIAQSVIPSGSPNSANYAAVPQVSPGTPLPLTKTTRNPIPTIEPTRVTSAANSPTTSSSSPSNNIQPYAALNQNGWNGINYNGVNCASINHLCIPPDGALAVSTNEVVEAVNDGMQVWNKQGGNLGFRHLTDATLFNDPNHDLSDPQVLYDSATDRFFASIIDINTNTVHVIVSHTNQAEAAWNQNAVVLAPPAGNLPDQPFMGMSNNVITISSNDYNGPNFNNFAGAEVWLINKAQLVAGQAAVADVFGPNAAWSSVHPATQLSGSTIQYFASTGFGNRNQATIFWVNVPNGFPTGNNGELGNMNQVNVGIVNISGQLWAGVQPNNTNWQIDVPDGRTLSAVWQQGNLWFTFNDAGTPQGDNTARDMFGVAEVSTQGNCCTATWSQIWGSNQVYFFYPAVTLDPLGDATVTVSWSGQNWFPSTGAYGFVNGEQGQIQQGYAAAIGSAVDQGIGANNQGCGFPSPANVCRFGDYFGAAADPTNDRVWLEGEYVANDGNAWSTWVSSYFTQPKLGWNNAGKIVPGPTTAADPSIVYSPNPSKEFMFFMSTSSCSSTVSPSGHLEFITSTNSFSSSSGVTDTGLCASFDFPDGGWVDSTYNPHDGNVYVAFIGSNSAINIVKLNPSSQSWSVVSFGSAKRVSITYDPFYTRLLIAWDVISNSNTPVTYLSQSTDGVSWSGMGQVVAGGSAIYSSEGSFIRYGNGELVIGYTDNGTPGTIASGTIKVTYSTSISANSISWATPITNLLGTQSSKVRPTLAFNPTEATWHLSWVGTDQHLNDLESAFLGDWGDKFVSGDLSNLPLALGYVANTGELLMGWAGTDSPSHLNVFPQNSATVYQSHYISQTTPPSTLCTGQQATVSVTMKNTGNSYWPSALIDPANPFRLGSQNPQDNTNWGMNRVELAGSVQPGDQAVFSWTVTAPSTPGSYNFQWRMVRELVTWFGDYTPSFAVSVVTCALNVSSNPNNVPADGTTTSTITIQTSTNAANVPVSISTSFGTLSSTTCVTGGTGSCTVTIKSSAVGTATVTATASGFSSGSTTVAFTDFTISTSSPSAGVGTSATATIIASGVNGFAGTVALSDTLPAGLTCSAINPTSLILPPSPTTATLTCSSTSVGNYVVTITGTSAGLLRTTTATFQFVGSLTASSSPSLVAADGVSSSTITVQTSNSQPGVTISLSTNLGTLSTSNCVTGANGACTVTITSTAPGSATVTATAAFYSSATTTVTFAAITLSASPTSVPADFSTTSTLIAQLSTSAQSVTVSFSSTGGVLSATSCTTSSTGSCSITIKSASPGIFTVTATAPSYSNGQTQVTFFDFTIAVSPVSITTLVGSQTSSTVTVTSVNGFSGTVNLGTVVFQDPTGLTCSVSPSSVTLGSSATATMTCNSIKVGNYTANAIGTSGTLQHGTYATYTVQDYSLSANPNSLVIQASATGSSTITVTSFNHFGGTVGFSITVNPYSLNCNLTPGSIIGSGTSTLSCYSAYPGNYTATITGTNNGFTRTTTVTYQITDYTLSFSRSTINIPDGRTGAVTVTVNSVNRFSGSVTLGVAFGLPSCIAPTFTPNPVTVPVAGSGTSSLSLAVATNCSASTNSVFIQGTSGPTYHAYGFTLTISNYLLTVSPTPAGINQGSSASFNVTATGYNSYPFSSAGPGSELQLSVSGLPSGVTASFTGSTTITISAVQINDTFQRQFGLTIDQPLPTTFWNTLPSSVIGISYSPFNYANSYTLPYGSHSLEFGISAYSGYWQVKVYVNGVLAGQATINVNVHVKLNFNSFQSSSLTLTVGKKAISGQYPITVTATDGVLTRTAVLDLRIGSFAISMSPNPTLGGISSKATTTVNVSSFFGVTDTLSLSAAGVPTCASASFGPSTIPLPGGGSSTLTLNLGSTCQPGSYTITVTATGTFTSNSATVTLTIPTPKFSLSLSCQSPGCSYALPPNYPVSDQMTVTSIYFTGTVGLSVSISPSGTGSPTAVVPSTVSLTSNGKVITWLNITSGTTIGNFNVTVTATCISGTCTSPVQTFTVYVTVGVVCGCGGGSVAAGTLITLADGSQMPVQNLAVGMQLLSYDMTTHQYVITTITKFTIVTTFNQMEIHTATGKPLIVDQNPAQKVYVELPDGTVTLMSVTDLKVGYDLFDATSQTWTTITGIYYQNGGTHTMYDIYTTFPGNYIANGYLDPVKT